MISQPYDEEHEVLLAVNKFARIQSNRGLEGIPLQQACQWKASLYRYSMWFDSGKQTTGIRKMEVAG